MTKSLIRIYIYSLLIFFVLPANAAKNVYNILYIQSYAENDTWSKEHEDGLKKGFSDASIDVNITTEYLDSRIWNSEGEEEIMRRICRKADRQGTDLIIVSNDEALYTLLTCNDSLPQQLPIVFFGVEFPEQELMNRFPNLTGLTSPHPYTVLLETAQCIFPNRKSVVLISEDTVLGRKGVDAFKKEWQKFIKRNPEYNIDEYDISNNPLATIVGRIHLSHNANNSIIVVPYWGLFMPSMAKVSKAPTFTLSASSLMQGGFGALTPNGYKNSRDAAAIAARILSGTPIEQIPVRESSYETIFDNKQLRFFDIDKSDLPKPAVIINQTYMEKYGSFIIGFYVLVVAFLLMWVIRLFSVNRREYRKRIHAQTRLLIQSRLVEQRNEFDNVFHSIRGGVITYDNDLRIHFVNRATLQMMEIDELVDEGIGHSYEGKMVGSICKLYFNGEDILLSLLKKAAQEGVAQEIPEGSFMQSVQTRKIFPVSGEVLPICSEKKRCGLALTFRNISQESMQRRFFNLAVEESSIYPWQYESDINSFIFTSGCISGMGFTSTTVHRSELNLRVHPDDRRRTIHLFDQAIKHQQQNTCLIFRLMNASGKYEWCDFRVSVIKGVTEKVPFSVLGVCQSIQQYKNTEEELIAARDKALQADKLKSAFLANMSHEIRTPLNAIVGFSDLLKDIRVFSDEEVENFISIINKNCELLLELINDVLDLSKVESGTMEFQFSSYFLRMIIQEVYESHKLNIPSGVELKTVVPDDEERIIVTDSLRLKQVLNNLISNAAKFTTEGSICLGYMADDEQTTFYVKDTGTGISPENLQYIFERFYKVDTFTQGAGLGLSICQTIVNRLHGLIWVESEVGVGTTFYVRIPNTIE